MSAKRQRWLRMVAWLMVLSGLVLTALLMAVWLIGAGPLTPYIRSLSAIYVVVIAWGFVGAGFVLLALKSLK